VGNYSQAHHPQYLGTRHRLHDADDPQRDVARSFLGLGIQPPQSSWGLLINYGVETMEEYPWLLIFPGIALSLTLFALNFLGDGLRDALDPRASKD
jgi:ABC-type antimicrobial peptide transport system permease subunit